MILKTPGSKILKIHRNYAGVFCVFACELALQRKPLVAAVRPVFVTASVESMWTAGAITAFTDFYFCI